MCRLLGPAEQKMIFTGMLEDREKVGVKRGERKTRILFAQKALKRGSDSFEEIADFYGLTIAEVEALARGRLVEA